MKLIPTGIVNFKELIDNGYYYVDKTKFIERVLNEQVVFYRSPPMFGKTLNMSMLYYFFSNKEKENAYLFNNLNISKNKEVLKHQNQYPVVFVSLKEMNETTMENQIKKFSSIISHIIGQFKEILDNDIFSIVTKQYINKYYLNQASKFELKSSLFNISRYLNKYYQKKVIILIDEYDVPLQAAYQGNYYDEMVDFLGSVFSSSLKTNDALKKGILTGCLRFSKEDVIIGGFNNFVSYSMLENTNDAFFGFTREEVVKILNDYNLSNSLNEIREWYGGYTFGKVEAFNPWSTLKYIQHRIADFNFKPVSFWKDSFCNNLIMKYLQTGVGSFRRDIDSLIHQNALDEIITSELIYSDIDNIINVYSFLFLTGYLKIVEKKDNYQYKLAIPNKEVCEIYKQSYLSYFENYKFERKKDFYQCLVNCDVDQANEILGNIFSKIIFFDDEDFCYHELLLELLNSDNESNIKFNHDSSKETFEIYILPKQDTKKIVLLECKHSNNTNKIIEDTHIAAQHAQEIIDTKNINGIGYGIAFFKKYSYIVKSE